MNSTASFSCLLVSCWVSSPENDPVLQDTLLCLPLPLIFPVVLPGMAPAELSLPSSMLSISVVVPTRCFHPGITNSPKIQGFALKPKRSLTSHLPSAHQGETEGFTLIYAPFFRLWKHVGNSTSIDVSKMRQNYADTSFLVFLNVLNSSKHCRGDESALCQI